jgi:hypothetical protein
MGRARHGWWTRSVAGLALAVVALGVAACDVNRERDWASEPGGLFVDVTRVDGLGLGSPTALLDLPDPSVVSKGLKLLVDVQALAADGSGDLSGDRWVRLSVRPGRLSLGTADGVAITDVLLTDGRRQDIAVTLTGAFGETRVWAEDLGYLPRMTLGTVSACSDGVDNDGDGLFDMADSGCVDGNDDSELSGSGAAGVSPPLYFRNPSLAEVQGYQALTPFDGESVTVDQGNMVVTRVTSDGMYVTDVGDTSGRGYNHMFIFNFSTPTSVPVCEADEGESLSCSGVQPVALRVCDRLRKVSGIMSEFYKFTEMSFPTWELTLWDPAVDGPCTVPEPYPLTADVLRNNGSISIEGLEGALVRVTGVQLPDPAKDFKDCDLNDDGAVDFRDYGTNACSAECLCREACDADTLCVELTQFNEFAQWPVKVGTAGAVKLWVSTNASVASFNPFDASVPRTMPAITGVLRNLSFLRPTAWILEPRCIDDLVTDGAPLPSTEACVRPRAGKED